MDMEIICFFFLPFYAPLSLKHARRHYLYQLLLGPVSFAPSPSKNGTYTLRLFQSSSVCADPLVILLFLFTAVRRLFPFPGCSHLPTFLFPLWFGSRRPSIPSSPAEIQVLTSAIISILLFLLGTRSLRVFHICDWLISDDCCGALLMSSLVRGKRGCHLQSTRGCPFPGWQSSLQR